jgi:hypothetical protein
VHVHRTLADKMPPVNGFWPHLYPTRTALLQYRMIC